MMDLMSDPVLRGRTDQLNLFAGSRSVGLDFFGISNWYWPWDTSRINPPAGSYSFARYCHISTGPTSLYDWESIETSKGVYDWTTFDQWVSAHAANGTLLMMELGKTPSWANPAGVNHAPTAMQDFADWCAAVATRAAGRIRYWFVRNEPRYEYTTVTTAKYAEMTRIASQVIKAIDPAAKIIGPESHGWDNSIWDAYITPYLTASAAGHNAGYGTGAGTTMLDWIDAVSIHTYQPWVVATEPNFDEIATRWRHTQAKRAGISKPIWVTEWMPIADDIGYVGSDLELVAVWRQLALAIANDAEKFVMFGWGGSAATWNQNNALGVSRRAWWADTVQWLMASPIVSVGMGEHGRITVTRADGQSRSDDYTHPDYSTSTAPATPTGALVFSDGHLSFSDGALVFIDAPPPSTTPTGAIVFSDGHLVFSDGSPVFP